MLHQVLANYNIRDKEPYPSMPRLIAALHWSGIFIRAAAAKAVSFSEGGAFTDIISVKLTNYTQKKDTVKRRCILNHIQLISALMLIPES